MKNVFYLSKSSMQLSKVAKFNFSWKNLRLILMYRAWGYFILNYKY